jgi:protein-S-isoprenylcysteine O-methyltransferase Ste14
MLFLFTATFALDHFTLFGLSQGLGFDINKALGMYPSTKAGISTRLHYGIVAHPIMTGFLMVFMGAPYMTRARLLFGVVNGLYAYGATKFIEEPYLIKTIGKPYEMYLSKVPGFCPFTSPARPAQEK